MTRRVQGIRFTGWQWFKRQVACTVACIGIDIAMRLWPNRTISDRAVHKALEQLMNAILEHDEIEEQA